MARPLVPDALWAAIEPLLPPPRPRPKGGRPPVPDRAALAGILFVLRSGIPWEMLPRERPAKLHADKGYDFARCRRACRRRGVAPRLARRGVEGSERLGRHRWVVERTLAWFARCRRRAVRYERRADIFEAFHRFAAALICLKFVERWFR